MRRILPPQAALALALSVAGCSDSRGTRTPDGSSGEAPAERTYFADPDLQRVYGRMMEAMGPDGGWDRLRYLEFDFVVDRGEDEPLRRGHRWDVWGGRYRVRAPAGEEEMVAVIDVNDPTGTEEIWLDGRGVSDPARSDSLALRAHAMFINDTYWLLMPYKWADPGVTAAYLGEMEMEGRPHEVVELTFDSVGLTPGNKYRGWVDPETGMMAYWQHWTRADDPEPRFTNAWTEWRRYGPVLLSSGRPDAEGFSRVRLENIAASERVPDGVFVGPEG